MVCPRGSASSVGGGVVCIRGDLHLGRGSAQGGHASMGVGQTPPQSDTMVYGQRAGGTHPNGMHSSYSIFYRLFKKIKCVSVNS